MHHCTDNIVYRSTQFCVQSCISWNYISTLVPKYNSITHKKAHGAGAKQTGHDIYMGSLEHSTPASREWEQALPWAEKYFPHSVRFNSAPVQLNQPYQDGPLPAPKVAYLGALTALRYPN